MSGSFPSIEDFNKSLSEVQIILRRAEKNQKNRREYDICIKSALLFLVAKFEAFLEDLVSDYIHTIESKGLYPADLPDILKLNYADKIIDTASKIRPGNTRDGPTIQAGHR